jgi:poly(3-hydroxybutyrate) depolymerase
MRSMKLGSSLSVVVLSVVFFVTCSKNNTLPTPNGEPLRTTQSITYNGVEVTVVIDKPAADQVHALVVYHGTVQYDSLIVGSATKTLDEFKKLLDESSDIMLVSVAYPEEGLLLGDNITYAEAGLLWVKERAAEELGIQLGKVFIAGHSQGGYLVTRLNTLHSTDGVVANAPGPLDLVFRCGLEESGQIPQGISCNLLRNTYGSTQQNPDAYRQRSLLHFTQDQQSDILFVQGMQDSPIQLRSWPLFRQALDSCTTCRSIQFVEIPDGEHTALFNSTDARDIFNDFIRSRID